MSASMPEDQVPLELTLASQGNGEEVDYRQFPSHCFFITILLDPILISTSTHCQYRIQIFYELI
jgi:hypothetical protein